MAHPPRESDFVPGTYNEQLAFRDLTGTGGAIDWRKVEFGFADALCDKYDECELAVLDRAARFYGLKRNSIALIANAISAEPSETIALIKSRTPSANAASIDPRLTKGITKANQGGEDCDYILGKALGVSTDVYYTPRTNVAAINAGRSVEAMRNMGIELEDTRIYGFGLGVSEGIGGYASTEMIYSAIDLYGLSSRVVGHYRSTIDNPSALSTRGLWIYETGEANTFLVAGDLLVRPLYSDYSSGVPRPEAFSWSTDHILSWLNEQTGGSLYTNFLDIRASDKLGLPRLSYAPK
jgi:hypothetical protein